MYNVSTQSAGSFSINVPQSALFSQNLVSLSANSTRLEAIDRELDAIFSIEKKLSRIDQLHIHNMQLLMHKIEAKYSESKAEMIPLDMMRLARFQERIDAVYVQYEPTKRDFLYAESLMEEKELLAQKYVH